jgi:DNA-binding protein H-NS
LSHYFFNEVNQMSQTYKELLQQRETLEKAIEQARQNEIASAVSKVRELVAEFGLAAQDLQARPLPRLPPNTVTPLPAKLGQVVARPLNGSMARTAISF